jgi:glycosyltransferase involved in cell wall biosynthesis
MRLNNSIGSIILYNCYFSVVIPLYNNINFVSRAIGSALAQSYGPLEIIIVDDGSTDGGGDLVVSYKNPLVKLIKQKNAGVGAARNTGAGYAAGDWVVFLDADDEWLPSHLEELAKLAKKFTSACLLGTSYYELHTGEQAPEDVASFKALHREVDYFFEASKNIGFICSSAVAVKKATFLKLGGFGSARKGEDTEFWARVALDCPVAVSNRMTSIYFRGTDGVMESKSLEDRDRPIKTLRDVAPVLGMLCDRQEIEPNFHESPSITAYINFRLLTGIKCSIYECNFRKAREIAALSRLPDAFKLIFWKLLLLLPNFILRIAVNMKKV